MTIVEAKLNTIIAAYDKLVKGIDDQAAMSRDRAYGGIIRAGKGELVESIATHLVQIAWEDVLHQNRARMEINKKKMPIGINEKYIERIADPRVKEYVAGSVGVYETQDIAAASAVADAVTVDAGAYTAGSQKVTFKLNYRNVCDATGAVSVYVHYKAVVKAEAAVKDAVTSGSAVLKYATSVEPTVTKTTAATTATVHTYAFSLAKTSDEDIEGGTGKKPLTNAGFTLYSDAGMANAVSMIKETVGGETYYRPALAGETGETVLLADMGDDQNTLLVRGLDVTTYYLKETKVPSGYYAPKGGFKVQLTGEREVVSETLTGKLAAASSFTATNNATDGVLINSSGLNTAEQNRLDASLKNSSTPVLPTTGGVGTVMFTVVGLLCMGAALWFFLFARRRRKDEQEQG